MAWKDKMVAMRTARHDEQRQAALAVLGPQATPDQIESHVKTAMRAQRLANANARETRRQQKIAEQNMMAAAVASGAQPNGAGVFIPSPTAPPASQTAAAAMFQPPPTAPTAGPDDLYAHPIFGAFSQPQGIASVAVYRLPSDLLEHRGVTPGYLQSMSFEEFSEDSVRINHGGGRFRATAKDQLGRVVRSGDFTISGRARAYTPAEEDNGNGHNRMGAFRLEGSSGQQQPDDAPAWLKVYLEHQDKRVERLEALIEASLAKPVTSDEDKLERWKKELEAKETAEQARHERRLTEMKAEMERDSAKEAQRIAAAQQNAQSANDRQSELLKTIVQSQSGVNQTLMTALVTKKDDGGAERFLVPMMEGMSAMMKAQNGTWAQLVGVLKDSMGGEDQRTTGTRLLDMIERGVSGLWDKAGDGLLMQIVSQLGKPKENAVPQQLPTGSAFQLPDGRIVPPEVCAQFIGRYQQLHGVNPSLEVCVAAFTDILNNMAGQQAPQAQAQAQPVQPAAQPQMQITQEQAEEYVRQAQQKGAEEALRAGKTAEEVQVAAKAAAQNAVAQLRAAIQGQQPAQAPPQPQALAQQIAPPPPAAITIPALQVPPSPAPAAIEAAKAAAGQAAPPVTPPAATAAVTAMVQPGPVPPQAAGTMLVQAGPIAPPGSVTIPWMHRGFLQFAIDSFQARQNPLAFLDLCLKQGKISPDAKLMIGRIYDDAAEDAPLTSVLANVAGLLTQRGVVMPGEFMKVFQSAPEGESWLETLLFACSYNTVEEAEKGLKEE
jgi:hypothetical protein